MRVAAQPYAGNADQVQQLGRLLRGLLPGYLQVCTDHVGELVTDIQHRVQRVHRALEDDGDLPPTQAGQLVGGELQDIHRRVHPAAGV